MRHVIEKTVLALFFFLILTPIAFLLRISGKSRIQLGYDKKLLSYWTPRSDEQSGARFDRQY
jgi:hypothetical protein